MERPFFDHYLRGGDDPGLPEALVFETGADDFITVTNRVHRSRRHPGHLEVGVLPGP
ncbi:MAG: hypothetical protein ACE5IK_00120 [Acidobacteriota bacterium]